MKPEQDYLQKYMVIFALEENATLEIIPNYVTKHLNIMLMLGVGKKKVSPSGGISQNYNK